MGKVIVFGMPIVRARRKPTTGFCEVTVLPTRGGDDREVVVASKPPKRRPPRKSNGVSRRPASG